MNLQRVLAGLISSPLLLTGTAWALDERGVDVPPKLNADNKPVTPANKAIIERVRQLRAILHRQPSLAALDGISLRGSIVALDSIDRMPAGTPIGGRSLTLSTWPVAGGVTPAGGKVDCPSRDGQKASQCGPGLYLSVNDIPDTRGSNSVNLADYHYLPMTPAPQQNGFEVHRMGDGVVLTKRKAGRTLFVPVTREMYLRDIGTPAALAELAAMPLADRGLRACSADRAGQTFKTCGPDDTYMGKVNPDYFDRSLGSGSVQLITIRYHEGSDIRRQALLKAVETLRAADLPLD